MKVVVTCEGRSIDNPVDPRFGRCQVFLFVDPDTWEVEAVPNEATMQGGGAGIQAAQFVANKGAKAVITGHVGPNAARALEAAGIEVYVGARGTAREALEAFREGRLQRADGATVSSHFGMGGGMGMGRGMGSGGGRSTGVSSAKADPAARNEDNPMADTIEELKRLKSELQEKMDQIQRKIEELERG